jgi:hypothetical protein
VRTRRVDRREHDGRTDADDGTTDMGGGTTDADDGTTDTGSGTHTGNAVSAGGLGEIHFRGLSVSI